MLKCAKNLFPVLTKHKRGPSLQCLITLFKSLVCSIVDYGLIVYGAASASNIAPIDVALRSILRLILGSFKSTPVEVIYAELGLEPSADRRIWLAAKYTLNLSTKPSNAAYPSAYSVVHDGHVWKPRSTPCLVAPIQRLWAQGWEGFDLAPNFITGPNSRNVPSPWTPLPLTIKWFPWSKEEAMSNKAEACGRINEWINSFPVETVFLYTDGSVCGTSKKATCAAFSPSLNLERSWTLSLYGFKHLHSRSSAIEQVLSFVYDAEDTLPEICILSDSKSAIQGITASSAKLRDETCLSVRNLASCLKASGTKVTLFLNRFLISVFFKFTYDVTKSYC